MKFKVIDTKIFTIDHFMDKTNAKTESHLVHQKAMSWLKSIWDGVVRWSIPKSGTTKD